MHSAIGAAGVGRTRPLFAAARVMRPALIGAVLMACLIAAGCTEIKTAADAYRVYYARGGLDDSAADYEMNHTTFTYFMMPDGLKALFRNNFPPEEMAGEIARILKRYADWKVFKHLPRHEGALPVGVWPDPNRLAVKSGW